MSALPPRWTSDGYLAYKVIRLHRNLITLFKLCLVMPEIAQEKNKKNIYKIRYYFFTEKLFRNMSLKTNQTGFLAVPFSNCFQFVKIKSFLKI